MHPPTPDARSRIPHGLAMLLVCVTFPLIWVGGLVTTYDAGMSVPDWPTTYGYSLFLYPWQTWLAGPFDLFIEHGHRLLGAASGLLTIALVAACWWCEPRRWVRAAAWAALALVVFQGCLGGARVWLDERLLALVHGCVGPLFFTLAVLLAGVTSHWWQSEPVGPPMESAAALRGLALTFGPMAYLQLVAGAVVRHMPVTASPAAFRVAFSLHLLLAASLLVMVIAVGVHGVRYGFSHRRVAHTALALETLVVLQLLLGLATWTAKYGWPRWLGEFQLTAAYTPQADGFFQSWIVTGHVAMGSLILAVAATLALRATHLSAETSPVPQPARAVESSTLHSVLPGTTEGAVT